MSYDQGGIVQDSGACDLAALALAGGATVGLVRVIDRPGPHVVTLRYDQPGQAYGPGVFSDPALMQPFGYVRVREGRTRAEQTWDYTREYYVLRDWTLQVTGTTLDISIVVPEGLTGPFFPATLSAWLSHGPAAEHEWSGQLVIGASLAGLQSAINVDGFDASVPRGATSLYVTVPTQGQTGAPFGAFPATLDVYQLDSYGNAIQVNRVTQAEKVAQLVCLAPLTRFVGVVDTTAAIALGSLPVTWRTHG
jgi:hypothetical protein